jgi:hypothetical protein
MMKRLPVVLATGCALVLAAVVAGCSDTPTDTVHSSVSPAPSLSIPTDTAVVDVAVTKPANPTPVQRGDLPPQAQVVTQFQQLTPDEHLCTDYAVKHTLDADPSMSTVNGKVAAVIGNAIVACTAPDRLGELLNTALASGGRSVSAEQVACLNSLVAADPGVAGRFFSAVLTANPIAVLSATQPLIEQCHLSLAG